MSTTIELGESKPSSRGKRSMSKNIPTGRSITDPASDDIEPLINANPQLQSYYNSLESRIGYKLLLGGARHFGYWEKDTWFPFPVAPALHRMEEKIYERFSPCLGPGSRILDAGCGEAAVACYLAKRGWYNIVGIDVVTHHLEKALRRITKHEKRMQIREGSVSVRLMDYHHIEALGNDTFDGVYAVETLSHATNTKQVLQNFFTVLRPGGRIVIHDYDHVFTPDDDSVSEYQKNLAKSMTEINKLAAMPSNETSQPGLYKQLLEEVGFINVEVRDFTSNIKPMMRLFWLIALIPYFFVRLLGLEKYFINTIAGADMYRGYGLWRYIQLTADKPEPEAEATKD